MVIIPAKRPQPMTSLAHVPVPTKLPLVSLVVACWGQLRYTQGLVESLEAKAGCEYELILVDNGCPEGTADWAERRGIKAIRMGENAGVPRAYNAGVKAAKGEIIGVWNNDMICHQGGVANLARASFERGIAAQSAGMWTAHGSYAGQTMEAYWSDYPDGYALMAQRQVWDDVGEWDAGYWPSYCDDVDWGLRARLKGYDWTLVEGSVHHYGGQTSQHFAGVNEHVARNQATIKAKYVKLGLGHRILVQRWGAHGDLLMATPAIRGLKAQFPLARLHVNCQSDAGKVLLGNPHVDAVFETPAPARAYTRTVNLNGAYERGQPHGTFTHPVLAFCTEAGVPYDDQSLDLVVSESSRAWAAEWLKPLAPAGVKLIAAGLRSSMRSKQNWSAEGWLALAEALPLDCRLIALDASGQPALGHQPQAGAAEAAFYAHPQVINITGRTRDFQELAAIISTCDGFVGVDSGPQHVASALGLPQVVLSAGSPLAARLALVGARHGFEGVAPCMPCQAPASCPRTDGPHCLAHVSGELVWQALEKLL